LTRQKILLTGASGLVGGTLAEVAARAGHVVTGVVGRWTGVLAGLAKQVALDLRDEAGLRALVETTRPDVIVNSAAVSEPAQCEAQPELAWQLNVGLPENLARLAMTSEIRLIHLSTEQVFDGARAPYAFGDVRRAINRYAQQKLEAEDRVLAASSGRAVVLRLPLLMGNSPGGRRSVHERLLRDWAEGRTARLFTDEIRQVCMADNLAAVLLELCASGAPAGVLHWAGAQPVSRYELGRAIAARFGLPAEKLIVATQLAGTPLAATRQHDLSMDLRPLSETLARLGA
jgi:dTDP-4-dehydrorhamnose reductase